MWGLPSPLHCSCPLQESSVVMDQFGYQQDEMPPILELPGCGLLETGSFTKTLSLLRAVGSSHYSAGLREPGLGCEPRDVPCMRRRKENLPHQSNHCIPHLWKMGRGALRSGFSFRAHVYNVCQSRLRTWLTLREGAEGADLCVPSCPQCNPS